ncbi:MAG: hypothetical protein ABIA92_00720 [Patescibacteria group bacterium]
MPLEIIEHNGVRYAEIIRSDLCVGESTFFSPPESSMQFGLLARKKGFIEVPHTHPTVDRNVTDCQQMVVVQDGIVVFDFYTQGGEKFQEALLHPGDAILLVDGAHSMRAVEDYQCVSVKQGPFLGVKEDKIPLEEA